MAADPTPEPGNQPGALQSASLGQRFANFIIDLIGQTLVSLLLLSFVGAGDEAEKLNMLADPNTRLMIGWGIGFVYYGFFESMFGITPGKLVTGTRVVSADGGRASLLQVLGRTCCRFIPLEGLSLLISPERRAWHDQWPRTYVIAVGGQVGSREF